MVAITISKHQKLYNTEQCTGMHTAHFIIEIHVIIQINQGKVIDLALGKPNVDFIKPAPMMGSISCVHVKILTGG